MPLFNEDFEGSILDRDQQLRYKLDRVYGSQKKVRTAHRNMMEAIERANRAVDDWIRNIEIFEEEVPKAIARDERRMRVYITKQEHELKKLRAEERRLKKLLGEDVREFTSIELEAIAKAKSIAIIEGILFAIEEWSDTDVPAADITLASQSVVFKAIHERIMKGDTDYFFDEVPHAAYEVVKRGREYVKYIRESSQVAMTEPSVWSQYAHEIQQWWINDGLFLLYGARDDDWTKLEPYTLDDMVKWRSTDLDKTTSFPYVFDAIELTRKYGDEIRESSGLPEFTRNTMQTRLTTHE